MDHDNNLEEPFDQSIISNLTPDDAKNPSAFPGDVIKGSDSPSPNNIDSKIVVPPLSNKLWREELDSFPNMENWKKVDVVTNKDGDLEITWELPNKSVRYEKIDSNGKTISFSMQYPNHKNIND